MSQSRTRTPGTLIIPALLGLFLITSSGFELVPALGTFNAKRMVQVGVLLAVLVIAAGSHEVRRAFLVQLGFTPRWIRYCLAFAVLLGFVSAVRFPHPGYGLAEVALLAVLVVLLLLVAACRHRAGARFDRLAMLLIAGLGLVVALQELTGLLGTWFLGGEFNYDTMLVRFSHPRFYNQLQTWTIPALAALPFLFGGGMRYKAAAVILLALQWCLLLISGGRGSFVSIVLALAMVALAVPGPRSRWLKIHAGGILCGFVLYSAVLAGHGAINEGSDSFVEQSVGRSMLHTTGRSVYWGLAWEDALRHPLLGAGPARFNCTGPDTVPAHPHNFPLQLLAEWGMPATLLILAVCAYLAWRLLARLRTPTGTHHNLSILRAMLAASVIAAAMHACLSGLLVMPASQVAAVLLCGWLLGSLAPAQQSAGAARFTAALVLSVAIAFSAGLQGFALLEARHMEQRTEALREALSAYPRFWQYGKICLYSYE